MKKLSLITITILTSLITQASHEIQNGNPEINAKSVSQSLFDANLNLPSDLKSTMKLMGSMLKTISRQATDASQNTNSAQMAENLGGLILHAKTFAPDSIASAPSSEQEALKTHYLQMLDETAALAQKLAEAFRGNNNELAQSIIPQLVQLKQHGHDEYR